MGTSYPKLPPTKMARTGKKTVPPNRVVEDLIDSDIALFPKMMNPWLHDGQVGQMIFTGPAVTPKLYPTPSLGIGPAPPLVAQCGSRHSKPPPSTTPSLPPISPGTNKTASSGTVPPIRTPLPAPGHGHTLARPTQRPLLLISKAASRTPEPHMGNPARPTVGLTPIPAGAHPTRCFNITSIKPVVLLGDHADPWYIHLICC